MELMLASSFRNLSLTFSKKELYMLNHAIESLLRAKTTTDSLSGSPRMRIVSNNWDLDIIMENGGGMVFKEDTV